MSDDLRQTTDLLRRTPDLLRTLLTGLPDGWTVAPDIDGGWRRRDVVGHLIFAGLAGARDGAVGPWRRYLGILLRRHDPAAIPD